MIYLPLSISKDYDFADVYLFVVVLLILSLLFAVRAKTCSSVLHFQV
jgi:hypothetical protein